jgi:hypothetical protein
MVLPPAQNNITGIAAFGAKLASLAIVHNHTYYIGLLAVAGVVVLLWRGIVMLIDSTPTIGAQAYDRGSCDDYGDSESMEYRSGIGVVWVVPVYTVGICEYLDCIVGNPHDCVHSST